MYYSTCQCTRLSRLLRPLSRKQHPVPPTPMSGVNVHTSRLANTKRNWRKSVPSFRRGSLSWWLVYLLSAHSFEQSTQISLQKATSCAAEADEWSQRAYKQIGQYATELAEVRVEFQARQSEWEASLFTIACTSALVRAGSLNLSPEGNFPRRRGR